MAHLSHDLDPEEVLISCLMLDAEQLDAGIQKGLSGQSFESVKCGLLFEAMVSVRANSGEIDIISVTSWLKSTGNMHKCSFADASRITAVSDSILAYSSSLEYVLRRSVQRDALKEAKALVKTLEAEYLSVDEMANATSPIVARITNATRQQGAARSIEQIADEALANMDIRESGGEKSNLIHWGIPNMDKWASPIASHELVVIAARPSVGKSSLARQLAWEAVKSGKRVAAFLLESSDVSFVEQCAAQESKMNVKKMMEEPRDRRDIYRATLRKIRGLHNLKVYDHDMTLHAIESRLRVLKSAFAPELVVVDYLQIIRRPSSNKSTADEIGDITRTFVSMVKHLGCPVILMSQLNRDSERQNREPGLADLRDSGSIESDANRVVFIHRKSSAKDGSEQSDIYRTLYECRLLQSKLRDGPKCAVDVEFHAPYATFVDDNKPTEIN